MNFECHITLDVETDPVKLEQIDSICAEVGFRRAKLYKLSGDESRKDTFVTGKSDDLSRLQFDGAVVHTKLRLFGFNVRRFKIEAILSDYRYD